MMSIHAPPSCPTLSCIQQNAQMKTDLHPVAEFAIRICIGCNLCSAACQPCFTASSMSQLRTCIVMLQMMLNVLLLTTASCLPAFSPAAMSCLRSCHFPSLIRKAVGLAHQPFLRTMSAPMQPSMLPPAMIPRFL